MSGSRSTRSWLYENRPSTHSAAMTMVAKTGLWIETRVNHMAVAAYERGAASSLPRPTATTPTRPDRPTTPAAPRCATTLAGAPSLRLSKRTARICASARQALHHLDPARGDVAAAGDDDAPDQCALLDRPDELLTRRLAERGDRHRHPLGAVGELDAGASVLSGAEAFALVVEDDDDADGARPGLRGGSDAVDPPVDVAALPLDVDRRRLPRSEERDLVRGDRSGKLERRQVDDGDDRLLRAHLLAGNDVALADDSRDRHRERRLAQADVGHRELRLCRLQLRARRVEARLRRLQRGRRDEVLRRETDVGGVLALGLDQRRLRRFDQRRAVRGAALQVGEIDRADHLACLDPASFRDVQRQQRSGRLGTHDRRSRRDQRPGEFDRHRQSCRDRTCQFAGDELERDRLLRRVLVGEEHGFGQHRRRRRRQHDRAENAQPEPTLRLVSGRRVFGGSLHGRKCRRTTAPRRQGMRRPARRRVRDAPVGDSRTPSPAGRPDRPAPRSGVSPVDRERRRRRAARFALDRATRGSAIFSTYRRRRPLASKRSRNVEPSIAAPRRGTIPPPMNTPPRAPSVSARSPATPPRKPKNEPTASRQMGVGAVAGARGDRRMRRSAPPPLRRARSRRGTG